MPILFTPCYLSENHKQTIKHIKIDRYKPFCMKSKSGLDCGYKWTPHVDDGYKWTPREKYLKPNSKLI